jgi:superfamily II DNA or RNA helicase
MFSKHCRFFSALDTLRVHVLQYPDYCALEVSFLAILIERGNVLSRVVTPLPRDVFDRIQQATRYRVDGYQFMPAYKKGNWDGYVNLFKRRQGMERTYPTGLEPLVVQALRDMGFDVTFSSAFKSSSPVKTLNALDEIKGVQLRDYQLEAVDVAMDRKRGIIQLPTGTGKTMIMCELIRQLNMGNVLVVVYHSKDLLRQTSHVLRTNLRMPVGAIGDGKIALENITVAISDSLSKEVKKGNAELASWLKDVRVVCVDEVHHIRAATVQACANACPNAEYRIGFSGTPFRDQGDDLEIWGAISNIIYYRKLTWMVENGYLCPPALYRITVDASGWIPPEEYYEEKENDLYLEEEWDDFESAERSRKSKEFMRFQKYYIWNNETRNRMIAKWAITLANKGYRGLVMCTNINQGRMIADMIPDCAFVYGKDTSEVRREVLEDLESGKYGVVVCTTIYNEGIDCPPASFMIPAQPYRSNVITIQQQGRVLRPYPGKSKAILVDIIDLGNKWFPSQAKARLKYYQSEPAIASTMKSTQVNLMDYRG